MRLDMGDNIIVVLAEGIHDPSGVGSEVDYKYDTNTETLIEMKWFSDGRFESRETPANLIDDCEVYPEAIRPQLRRLLGMEE